MTDLMPAGVISDLIRTVLTTLIDRPAFLILGVVYEVFFKVATAELFTNELVRTIYYRCQMVIGIFMLFKFSVTILEGIVDPNRVTDKKNGAGKIISRIITSLVILALITPINIPNPSNKWEEQLNSNGIIFGALYSLQDRILTNNTLGKLILGTLDNSNDKNASLKEAGDEFTKSILQGFIRYNLKPLSEMENNKYEKPIVGSKEYESNPDNRVCRTDSAIEKIYEKGTTQEIISMVNLECSAQSGGVGTVFGAIKKLAGAGRYVFAYSPIGGVAAYIISIILIGFTVDIAIRAIKLAVLRLIAPIPIISHMNISAKEGKGADSFSLWIKSITTTYIDLFVRLAVLYFVIALIHDMLANGIRIDSADGLTGLTGAIAFVFIIIGLFLFARQAPKFLQDVLGLQGTMSNIGLSAILAGAGALRTGGTFHDALNATRDSVDSNINAINSGKAAPGLGLAYNSGRDLAAKMITGNEKMTYQQMQRGRAELAREGITAHSADAVHNAAIAAAAFTDRMADDAKAGRFTYMNNDGTTGTYKWKDDHGVTHNVTNADEMALALDQQRTISGTLQSKDKKIDAEVSKYGESRSWRDKKRMDNTGTPARRNQYRADRHNTRYGSGPDVVNVRQAGVDVSEHN